MSEFKREVRYTVIKHNQLTESQMQYLKNCIFGEGIPTVEAVVVESDWPEFEPVWKMIEDRVSGAPVEGGKAEYDALAQAMTTNQTIDGVPRRAVEWAFERLEICQDQAFQSCECEECEQCGKMPDECSGTDCAKTCQCSTCDHCSNALAMTELRALLDAPAALGEIDLTPKRLAHAEIVIEQQNNLIASLRAELVESYCVAAQGDPTHEDRESLIGYGRSSGLDEASTLCTRLAYAAYYPPGTRFKAFTPKAQKVLGDLLIKAANEIASLPGGPYERFKARQAKKSESAKS